MRGLAFDGDVAIVNLIAQWNEALPQATKIV